AKLNKNYGITRMDPYVRLRIGQTVYETNTDYNGARNPRWNKNFNCYFLPNDTCIDIENLCECAFSLDDKIAWACYDIPESVLQGETLNVWIELSGKLGKGKEGLINLVITCQPVPSGTLVYHSQPIVAVMPYGSVFARDAAAYPQCITPKGQSSVIAVSNPVPAAVQEVPEHISKEDLKQVIEMFPNIEEEVVQTVMDSNRGNKDQTINALLALSEGT
ncbi:toll-interacting protein-like, partial [Stegodyphus dumicola]|uniref:toll-interacting protein-like n=1 Tax=Stegodyphus dumicola TaxID=202533 RepID=UPI0015AB4D48